MKLNLKSILLGTAVSALCPALASAQSNATASAQETPAAPATDHSTYGDIIVTAQRRSERLSDIPVSITAVTSDSIAKSGITDSRQLIQLTPGLSFQSFGSSAQPYIRGIGSNGATTGDSSNVSTYIDGVYQPFQPTNFFTFDDVERIEVLKGPQGTFFGRNAAGGAISVVTRGPKLNEPTGQATASYGSFNEVKLSGFVSVPLGSDFAASIAGNLIHNDGFRDNIFLNKKSGYNRGYGFRGKLLFEPDPATRILLEGNYRWSNDLTSQGNQPLDGNVSIRATVPTVLIASAPNTEAANLQTRNVTFTGGGSLKIEHDFNFATITSLSAFSRAGLDFVGDSDLTPLSNNHSYVTLRDNMIQQDLILTSRGTGPFRWVLGGSYYHETGSVDSKGYGGSTTSTNPDVSTLAFLRETYVPDIKINAYAVYAELNYKIFPELTLTAGGRYSHDTPSFYGYRYSTVTQQPDLRTAVTSTPVAFSSFTPHVALRYQIDPTTNVYASYSRGFKAGVVNANSLQPAAVKPENVDAFEVGMKHNSRVFSLDFAGYYTLYKDVQFTSYGANTSIQLLRNAAAAKIYGFEANATVRPVTGLSMRGGVAYTHARYTDFVGAPGYIVRTNASGTPIGGNVAFSYDATGRPMIRTPLWQANGSINYEKELDNGSAVGAGINGSYFGSIFHDVAGNFRQPAYSVFNGNLSYTLPGGRMKATAFANNIFNKTYLVGVLISASGTSVTYSKPANYGLRLEFSF